MKATQAIEQLQKLVEKYGTDIDVFVTAPGFNSTSSFDVRGISYFVGVENLDEYPKHLIFEEHGDNNGLIYGAVFIGKNQVDYSG